MVDGGGLHPAHHCFNRRLGNRRSLSTLLFARNTIVSRLGARRPLLSRALSLSRAGTRRVHHAAYQRAYIYRFDYQFGLRQCPGSVFNNLAVSDPHDTIDFCLRSIFHCLRRERDVLTSGTRTKTQNVQRDLSSSAVTFNRQRTGNSRGWDRIDSAYARNRDRDDLVVSTLWSR